VADAVLSLEAVPDPPSSSPPSDVAVDVAVADEVEVPSLEDVPVPPASEEAVLVLVLVLVE
jgi:hypothetical protein